MGQILSFYINTKSLSDIDDFNFKKEEKEEIEEIRMISGFDVKEILRLKEYYFGITQQRQVMTLDEFKTIPGIGNSPLCDRICHIMGLSTINQTNLNDSTSTLTLKAFICGLSLFNSPIQREQKLKTAFTIQDYDGDGQISRSDMRTYLKAITTNTLTDEMLDLIVNHTFEECSSDNQQEFINFTDFQRVVAPTDFHLKLRLPI